jgi:hypothetical protein
MLLTRIAKYGPDGGLGEASEAKRFRDDALLLVKVAAEHFEGRVAQREITNHPQIKGILSWDRVQELARRLQNDGVIVSGSNRQARRLAPLVMKNPDVLHSMYGAESALYHAHNAAQRSPNQPQRSHNAAQHSPGVVSNEAQQDAAQRSTSALYVVNDPRILDSHRPNPAAPPPHEEDSDTRPAPEPPTWWKALEGGEE